MKAAGKSEWATYGALAVAAALALLLVMARPLPAGLKTTLHFRLEEPTDPGAGIEVAVRASGEPRVTAATLSAGPDQQATLAQAQPQAQQEEQAAQAQPAEDSKQDSEAAGAQQAGPEEPAGKVAPVSGDQSMTQQPTEQQQAQQADSQPAAEQQEQQAAQAQPAGSQPAEGKAEQQQQQQQQQQQAPTQQEQAEGQEQEQQQTEAQQPAKRGIDIYREFQANVSSCFNEWAGLECLRQQKDWTPGPGQYRFPHFAIIGFQKCATTSLFHHLAAHPQVLHSFPKEPEFFTETCNFNALRCNRTAQFQYMRDVLRFVDAQSINFTAATFEGSTHYALEGRWLAPQMAHLFPWLRMIVSMREPISQAISMVFHNLDSNRNVGCYQRGNGQIYRCGLEYLEDESRYANWLKPWLAAYPPEQLYLFQYENLTATENTMGALRDLKRFLGVAKALPNDELPVRNARHQTKQTEGWPMLRWQYWKLVEKARRNMMEVVEIVEQYGYADPQGWVKNWEAWWQMNLDERCGAAPDSECMILLS